MQNGNEDTRSVNYDAVLSGHLRCIVMMIMTSV